MNSHNVMYYTLPSFFGIALSNNDVISRLHNTEQLLLLLFRIFLVVFIHVLYSMWPLSPTVKSHNQWNMRVGRFMLVFLLSCNLGLEDMHVTLAQRLVRRLEVGSEAPSQGTDRKSSKLLQILLASLKDMHLVQGL